MEIDWNLAEEYLKECESAYAETGTAGALCMNIIIRPLRDRFNRGERTVELYDEIMDLSL